MSFACNRDRFVDLIYSFNNCNDQGFLMSSTMPACVSPWFSLSIPPRLLNSALHENPLRTTFIFKNLKFLFHDASDEKVDVCYYKFPATLFVRQLQCDVVTYGY